MRSLFKHRKGQMTIRDAPAAVMIVGFIFLIMATVAYVSQKYGDTMNETTTAYNVTRDLNAELLSNTSIAGIVLTIALIGVVLSVLIGVFVATRRGGI